MFTNEQLQNLIDGKIIGHQFPYDSYSEEEIEAHIRRLFYRINRIPNLVCEAEWNHFGSGYASFVEFFCYRKADVTLFEEKGNRRTLITKGIIIDVCRLAPVAIMGEDDRYKTICTKTNELFGGAYGTLLADPRRLTVGEQLQTVAQALSHALVEFDYNLLEEQHIHHPLTFQTNIPTIYRKPKDYLVMDAIFYWID